MEFFSQPIIPESNELSAMIRKGAFLVDVRTPAEFMGGSADGAVNIPLDDIPGMLSSFKDKQNIIVFCKTGIRGDRAKNILKQYGFNNVTNGGNWQNISQHTIK